MKQLSYLSKFNLSIIMIFLLCFCLSKNSRAYNQDTYQGLGLNIVGSGPNGDNIVSSKTKIIFLSTIDIKLNSITNEDETEGNSLLPGNMISGKSIRTIQFSNVTPSVNYIFDVIDSDGDVTGDELQLNFSSFDNCPPPPPRPSAFWKIFDDIFVTAFIALDIFDMEVGEVLPVVMGMWDTATIVNQVVSAKDPNDLSDILGHDLDYTGDAVDVATGELQTIMAVDVPSLCSSFGGGASTPNNQVNGSFATLTPGGIHIKYFCNNTEFLFSFGSDGKYLCYAKLIKGPLFTADNYSYGTSLEDAVVEVIVTTNNDLGLFAIQNSRSVKCAHGSDIYLLDFDGNYTKMDSAGNLYYLGHGNAITLENNNNWENLIQNLNGVDSAEGYINSIENIKIESGYPNILLVFSYGSKLYSLAGYVAYDKKSLLPPLVMYMPLPNNPKKCTADDLGPYGYTSTKANLVAPTGKKSFSGYLASSKAPPTVASGIGLDNNIKSQLKSVESDPGYNTPLLSFNNGDIFVFSPKKPKEASYFGSLADENIIRSEVIPGITDNKFYFFQSKKGTLFWASYDYLNDVVTNKLQPLASDIYGFWCYPFCNTVAVLSGIDNYTALQDDLTFVPKSAVTEYGYNLTCYEINYMTGKVTPTSIADFTSKTKGAVTGGTPYIETLFTFFHIGPDIYVIRSLPSAGHKKFTLESGDSISAYYMSSCNFCLIGTKLGNVYSLCLITLNLVKQYTPPGCGPIRNFTENYDSGYTITCNTKSQSFPVYYAGENSYFYNNADDINLDYDTLISNFFTFDIGVGFAYLNGVLTDQDGDAGVSEVAYFNATNKKFNTPINITGNTPSLKVFQNLESAEQSSTGNVALYGNTSMGLDGELWYYNIYENTFTRCGAGAIGNSGITGINSAWSNGDLTSVYVNTKMLKESNNYIYCYKTNNSMSYKNSSDIPWEIGDSLLFLYICPKFKSSKLALIEDSNNNQLLYVCNSDGVWNTAPLLTGSKWGNMKPESIIPAWGENGNLLGAFIKIAEGTKQVSIDGGQFDESINVDSGYFFDHSITSTSIDTTDSEDTKYVHTFNSIPSALISGASTNIFDSPMAAVDVSKTDNSSVAVAVDGQDNLTKNPNITEAGVYVSEDGKWISKILLLDNKNLYDTITSSKVFWNSDGSLNSLAVKAINSKNTPSYYLYDAATKNWCAPTSSPSNIKLTGAVCSNSNTAVIYGVNPKTEEPVIQFYMDGSWKPVLQSETILIDDTITNVVPCWNNDGSLGSVFFWTNDKKFWIVSESSIGQYTQPYNESALDEIYFEVSNVTAVLQPNATTKQPSLQIVSGAVIKADSGIYLYTLSGTEPVLSDKLPTPLADTWSVSDNIVKLDVDLANPSSVALWTSSENSYEAWICENGVWATTPKTNTKWTSATALEKFAALWKANGSFDSFTGDAVKSYSTPQYLPTDSTADISNGQYEWTSKSNTSGSLIISFDFIKACDLTSTSQLQFDLQGATVTSLYASSGPSFKLPNSIPQGDGIVTLVSGNKQSVKEGTTCKLNITLSFADNGSENVSVSNLKFNQTAVWPSKDIYVKFNISGLPSGTDSVDINVGETSLSSITDYTAKTLSITKNSPAFIAPAVLEGYTYTCSPEFITYSGYRVPPTSTDPTPNVISYSSNSSSNPQTITITYTAANIPNLTQNCTMPDWPDKIAMGTMWNTGESGSYYKNGLFDFITVYTRNGACMQTTKEDQYQYIFPGQIRNLNDFCATLTKNQFSNGAKRACRPLATIYTANLSGGDLNGAMQTMGLYGSTQAETINNAQLLTQNFALAASVAYVLENKIGGNNPLTTAEKQAESTQQAEREAILQEFKNAQKTGDSQLATNKLHQIFTAYNADQFIGKGIITDENFKIGSIVVNPDFLAYIYQNTTDGDTVMGADYCIDYVMRFLINWLEDTTCSGNFQYSSESSADVMSLNGSPLTIQKQTATLCNSWEGMIQDVQNVLNSSFIYEWNKYTKDYLPPTAIDDNGNAIYPKGSKQKPYPLTVTETFTDNFDGYVKAVNYLINRYGPNVTFGWDCGVYFKAEPTKKLYGKEWVHYRNPSDAQALINDAYTNYYSKIKLVDSTNHKVSSDFLVFDLASYSPLNSTKWLDEGWLMNGPSFNNWFNYIEKMTKGFGVPGMIWQMAGGRLPTNQDMLDIKSNDNESTWQWGGYYGSLPNYIFGTQYTDNSTYKNYNPAPGLTDLPSELGSTTIPQTGNYLKAANYSTSLIKTVQDYLNDQGLDSSGNAISGNWDWTQDNLSTLKDAGIFAIEFGGLSLPMAGICNAEPAPNKNWLYQSLLNYWQDSSQKPFDTSNPTSTPGVQTILPTLKAVLPKIATAASQSGKAITVTVNNGILSTAAISKYITAVSVGSASLQTPVPYSYNVTSGNQSLNLSVNVTYKSSSNKWSPTKTLYQNISMDLNTGDLFNFSRASAASSSFFDVNTLGLSCTVTPKNGSSSTAVSTGPKDQAVIPAATMNELKTNGGTVAFSIVYVQSGSIQPKTPTEPKPWSSTKLYSKGAEVTYNGQIYKANDQSEGTTPGSSTTTPPTWEVVNSNQQKITLAFKNSIPASNTEITSVQAAFGPNSLETVQRGSSLSYRANTSMSNINLKYLVKYTDSTGDTNTTACTISMNLKDGTALYFNRGSLPSSNSFDTSSIGISCSVSQDGKVQAVSGVTNSSSVEKNIPLSAMKLLLSGGGTISFDLTFKKQSTHGTDTTPKPSKTKPTNWNSSTSYPTAGYLVTYDGKEYISKNWTKGTAPGTSGSGWELKLPMPSKTTPTAWNSETNYPGKGYLVTFNGKTYISKYYISKGGKAPDNYSAWELDSN